MAGILLFEDKLGITSGYEGVWQTLLLGAGFGGIPVHKKSAYRKFGSRVQLLTRKGNRKSPGFNEDLRTQDILRHWIRDCIEETRAVIILCMDPALFFIANPNWDQATPDNMRGGVYDFESHPFLPILPISAWHTKKQQKDIAILNEGHTDKEEWEEEHGGEEQDVESEEDKAIWLDPIVVPYGKFVLRADLAKANRIYRSIIAAQSATGGQ